MGPRDPVGADPEDPVGAVHEILLVLEILLLLVWVLVSAIVNPNTGKKEEDKAAKKKKKIGKQHCEIHTISQEMSKRDEFSSRQSSHQYR